MKAQTLIRRTASEGISVETIAEAIVSVGHVFDTPNDKLGGVFLPPGIREGVAEFLGYELSITYHAAFDAAVAYMQQGVFPCA